jgi:subtilisin family serine protease
MSRSITSAPPRNRMARLFCVLALIVTAVSTAATAAAKEPSATVDPQVLAELGTTGQASFFVYLMERADLTGAAVLGTHQAKATHVYQRLTETARRSQAALTAALRERGTPFQPFWISNTILVTGDKALLDELAARKDVDRIEAARTYRIPEPTIGTAGPAINSVEWNITNIQAPRVWSELGVRGDGITVANIDTGVQYTHPALVRQYRGNTGSGFNHNYNWFDPAKVCGNPSLAPCDNNNHGTHTMGTMVGEDATLANQIGVAPGAKWIAAKGCETGSCSSGSLLAAGQWVIAPTDLNGANPRPELAADVVNNSWGGGQGDTWYRDTIRAWIAAGTFPVFSQGNSGSACGSANSPGDNAEAYGVGAYDINNALASFSSRGPSTFGEIKPNIAAPGVNVRSSVANNGYSAFNGTSMAAPHVSGTVALIWSASATLRGDIDGTRALLDDTAADVNATACGGTLDDNNMFGEGRLNAFAAVSAAPRGPTGTLAGRVTDAATGAGIAGAVVQASGPAQRSATTASDGSYTMALSAGTYTVTASHGLYNSRTVSGVAITVNVTTTQNFALTRLPTGTLTGVVTDQASGLPLAGAAVTVSGPTSASTSTNANGRYTFTLPAGTYSVTASMALYHARTVSGVVVQTNLTTTQNLALLPNFGAITGTVTRASNGTVVAGASVTLFGGPGGTFRTTTDSAGRYTITRVQSGQYTLFVSATGCFLSNTTPVIQDGQTLVHNVRLNCT